MEIFLTLRSKKPLKDNLLKSQVKNRRMYQEEDDLLSDY